MTILTIVRQKWMRLEFVDEEPEDQQSQMIIALANGTENLSYIQRIAACFSVFH
jgi:hypothetical protein